MYSQFKGIRSMKILVFLYGPTHTHISLLSIAVPTCTQLPRCACQNDIHTDTFSFYFIDAFHAHREERGWLSQRFL